MFLRFCEDLKEPVLRKCPSAGRKLHEKGKQCVENSFIFTNLVYFSGISGRVKSDSQVTEPELQPACCSISGREETASSSADQWEKQERNW